jgi:hypothetical protein
MIFNEIHQNLKNNINKGCGDHESRRRQSFKKG